MTLCSSRERCKNVSKKHAPSIFRVGVPPARLHVTMPQKTITLTLNVRTLSFKRIKFYHASGSTPTKINANLMFIGPCIIVIFAEWKTNLMSLAILFHFLCAQHVSDINIAIIRSLLLCWWITTSVVLFSVRCVLELLVRLVLGCVRFAGWISLAILFHFLCAQHISDINIPIIRSLRLCWWITTSVVLFSVRCVLELLVRLRWCSFCRLKHNFSLQNENHPKPPAPNL